MNYSSQICQYDHFNFITVILKKEFFILNQIPETQSLNSGLDLDHWLILISGPWTTIVWPRSNKLTSSGTYISHSCLSKYWERQRLDGVEESYSLLLFTYVNLYSTMIIFFKYLKVTSFVKITYYLLCIIYQVNLKLTQNILWTMITHKKYFWSQS